MSQAVIYTKQI